MGRLQRLGVYFRTMFPLHVNLPVAALALAGFVCATAAVRGDAVPVTVEWWWGFATVVLTLLLLRVFDELKDAAADPALFPERPLVTGAVRYSDVRWLGLATVLALLALNFDRGPATTGFLLYFGFAVLSWQWWFFPEELPPRPVLVLATHQPLVPLSFGYVYAVYLELTGSGPDLAQAVLLPLAFWPPGLAWEVARKVRAPEQEDAYLTYSRRWGTRRAAAVVLVAFAVAAAGMVALGVAADWSVVTLAFYPALALGCGAVILRFVHRPTAATNHVRCAAEAFVALYYGAPVAEWWFRGGA